MVNRFEKEHARRLVLETSWLNYTRNAIIASVSGLAMFQAIKGDINGERYGMKPVILMLGTGFAFMMGGTVQYAFSLIAFEKSPAMMVWGLGNAIAVFGLYSAGLFKFLEASEFFEDETITF